MFFRMAFYGSVFVFTSGIGLIAITNSEDVKELINCPPQDLVRRSQTFLRAIIRLWRDLYCATIIVADYEWSLKTLEGEALKQRLKQVHLRSALRLRELMRTNGGIYIKLGQHVAQMQFLLPDEYVDTMRPMLNQAPTSSLEDVRRVFAEEFGGRKLEDVFDEFELTPIASASLAQVHFATLRSTDGLPPRRVAIKVQHAALEQNTESDIATVSFIIKLIHKIDSRFDYAWLADEMRENLPLECDFVHEAQNSERARRNLRVDERDDVLIPRIHWAHTSKRVLTMERMDGCLINDVPSLKAQGIDLSQVSTLMATVFSEMIFTHGFVHCDPHAGNMLIQPRSKEDSRPRLVLLDHGLYRELTDEFRLQYAHLWSSLIRGDPEGIKKYAQLMNAGEMYPLFASMLTRKPYHLITKAKGDANVLMSKNDESERAQLQAWAVQYAEQVQAILARIPKPLLLLLKTNDCLRAVDTQLGTPINSFVIMARFCTKAINRDRLEHSNSWADWLGAAWDSFTMEVRVQVIQIVMAWAKFWHVGGAPGAAVAKV